MKHPQENNTSSRSSEPAQSREELLAADLAIALGDRDNFSLYLKLASNYPEQLLRKVLAEVRKIPAEKIRKSRGALFTYLVKRYDRKTFDGPWN